MKIVGWDEVFAPYWAKMKSNSGNTKTIDILAVIKEFVNKMGKQKLLFKGLIEHEFIPHGYAFLFQEYDKEVELDYIFMEDVIHKHHDEAMKKGLKFDHNDIYQILEDMDIVADIYVPTLRYELSENGKYGKTKPIYFTIVNEETTVPKILEKPSVDYTDELFEKYKKETGKVGKVGKNITTEFKDWVEFHDKI